MQRRNDVGIKYRGYLAHNFPTPCRFRCREATCSPLQYNCTFCVSSIRKISECFATSRKTFARLQSVRNKGSKGYPVTTLSRALFFFLSRLFRFSEFSAEFFLSNRSPNVCPSCVIRISVHPEYLVLSNN